MVSGSSLETLEQVDRWSVALRYPLHKVQRDRIALLELLIELDCVTVIVH